MCDSKTLHDSFCERMSSCFSLRKLPCGSHHEGSQTSGIQLPRFVSHDVLSEQQKNLPKQRTFSVTRLAKMQWDLESLKTGRFADRDHRGVVFGKGTARGKDTRSRIINHVPFPSGGRATRKRTCNPTIVSGATI